MTAEDQTSTLQELYDSLSELRGRYDYNPDGSDYECIFCRRRPVTNRDSIEHAEDCLGEKLLKALPEILVRLEK